MITLASDFFAKGCGRCARFDTAGCSALIWSAGLLALRAICRDMGLVETVKWGHPCYRHGDRNIVLIGALQGDFRLNFFNAGLMKDPDGLMVRQGPNPRHPDSIMFRDAAEVAEREVSLRAYLAEAMRYAEAGIKAEKTAVELDLPGALIEAMEADAEFAGAFHALTPGRQRSYVIALSGAKTAATRVARIGKFRSKVMLGKGANEY